MPQVCNATHRGASRPPGWRALSRAQPDISPAAARNPRRCRLQPSNARSQWLCETTPAGVILSTICGSTVDNAVERSWGVIPTFAASWAIVSEPTAW